MRRRRISSRRSDSGDASAPSVANRVRDEVKHDNVVDFTRSAASPAPRKSVRRSSGVRIAGVDDVLVRVSESGCSPVPGDPINGVRHDRPRRQRAIAPIARMSAS